MRSRKGELIGLIKLSRRTDLGQVDVRVEPLVSLIVPITNGGNQGWDVFGWVEVRGSIPLAYSSFSPSAQFHPSRVSAS